MGHPVHPKKNNKLFNQAEKYAPRINFMAIDYHTSHGNSWIHLPSSGLFHIKYHCRCTYRGILQ